VALGSTVVENHTRQQFRNYWYPKGAEISRFSLKQSRYGEIHEGDAVLIYVTESMNPKIQVKADNPGHADVPILKLNATRKFFTGIYPYSMMTSIFAPVDAQLYRVPLKISSSTQEWCGNVYTQMNLQGEEYHVKSYSYFEKEADRSFFVKSYFPEDAIWTTIRIAPINLPRGEFFLIPGSAYTRLSHRPLQPIRALGSLQAAKGQSLEGKPLVSYEVQFPTENRTLKIYFETEFPFRIQGWEDTYRVSGKKPGILTTSATRTHTILIDYWNHNHNTDRKLLNRLGLGDRELAGRKGDK
jgi:hypothetical protein